jgi:hypothetical protein
MTVSDGNSVACTYKYVIAHALETGKGRMLNIIDEEIHRKTNPVALLPHGAVALRLDAPDEYIGTFAVFLPIGMALGAPVVVHGCFQVDSSRKNIDVGKDGNATNITNKTEWNRLLLEGPIATSYLEIVKHSVSPAGWNPTQLPAASMRT